MELFSRDDWTRTSGLFVPNEARYRAALHPENLSSRGYWMAKIRLCIITGFRPDQNFVDAEWSYQPALFKEFYLIFFGWYPSVPFAAYKKLL